jgi:predicted GH43/DUF377 family glycosyl hydrolase
MEQPIFDHSSVQLRPDASRTILKPFYPDYPEPFADTDCPRVRRIVERVMHLAPEQLSIEFDQMVGSLLDRHCEVEEGLFRRYREIRERIPQAVQATYEQRLVLGAYFSAEYSFQAAALFNPSMVRHPDQDRIEAGQVRFLISMRGIGEGHLSSVTFRTGIWCPRDGFSIDKPSLIGCLPEIDHAAGDDRSATDILFHHHGDYSETVLFPVRSTQAQGIEDLRLVSFIDDAGEAMLLGTYTAFDGRTARSELLRVHGAKSFTMITLRGSMAETKGMALFPRRVDGRFVMLGRQDNESIWIATSDDLLHWEGGSKLLSPAFPWEYVQLGNCGAPIEIDEGWLVLTHGVGMTRNYTMGACLLDKNDPTKLLGRTSVPILRPRADERDGYVPNVVYSCGAVVHGRTLLLPYGVADHYTAFASASVDKILRMLV